VLNALQTGLSMLGFVPGFGAIADVVNAGISAARGDYLGAGFSLAAAVPFIGDFAAAGKAIRSVTQVSRVSHSAAPVMSAARVERAVASSALNPNTIRFSQDSIKARFQNTVHGTIDDLAAGLRSGTVKPSSIEPIRLVEREGHLISIDNRRLEAFRRAGVDVPNRMATPAEIQQAIGQGKFSAGDLGGSTIRIR
jgi:plasmid stabilization system protein ParE